MMKHRSLLMLPIFAGFFLSGRVDALQGESIFIKGLLGPGYTMVSESADDIKVKFNGISGISFLQAGGALSKSWKVFGFTGISVAPSPGVKTENLKIDTVYSMQTIFDFGLGLAYYTRDGISVSVGGSIAQSFYKFTVYGTDVGTYTRHGWGSHILVGKEFPLSGRLSFGVSAIGYYGRVYDVGGYPFQNAPVDNIYAGILASLMYD